MKSPRKLWLARHGNRQDFIDPNWYKTNDNPWDPPLSEDGLLQAKELGERLQREPIDHLFVSPFLRTVQTALEVQKSVKLPIQVENGLSEHLQNFPLDFDVPALHVKRQESYPQLETAISSKCLPAIPEAPYQVNERMNVVLNHLLKTYEGNLLVISHASPVVRGAWALSGDTSSKHLHVAGFYQLEQNVEGGWKITHSNEMGHLTSVYTESPFLHVEPEGFDSLLN